MVWSTCMCYECNRLFGFALIHLRNIFPYTNICFVLASSTAISIHPFIRPVHQCVIILSFCPSIISTVQLNRPVDSRVIAWLRSWDHGARQSTVAAGWPATAARSGRRTGSRRRRLFLWKGEVVPASQVVQVDPTFHDERPVGILRAPASETERVNEAGADVASSALRIATLALTANADWLKLHATRLLLARVDLARTRVAGDDRFLRRFTDDAGAWVPGPCRRTSHATSPLTTENMHWNKHGG